MQIRVNFCDELLLNFSDTIWRIKDVDNSLKMAKMEHES